MANDWKSDSLQCREFLATWRCNSVLLSHTQEDRGHGYVITPIIMCGMKILMHSKTSTVVPLKFGNYIPQFTVHVFTFSCIMASRPWCMSGSLTRGGGENVPGIPGACATHYFMYVSDKRPIEKLWRASIIFLSHVTMDVIRRYDSAVIISRAGWWYSQPVTYGWCIKHIRNAFRGPFGLCPDTVNSWNRSKLPFGSHWYAL